MLGEPETVSRWIDALTADGTGVFDILGPAVIAFPLLVLGLSGFETGVSMMPLVATGPNSGEQTAEQRLEGAGP